MLSDRIPDDEAVTSPGEQSLDPSTFEFVEQIGETSTTTVHRVSLPKSDSLETIAVKHPRIDGTLPPDAWERFDREGSRWSRIDDHSHIVGVVDWGTDRLPWLSGSEIPWIAMEYMDGGSLESRVGTLDRDQALWTAKAVADGVWNAHHAGLLHRDLKPTNVLFRSTPADSWDVPKVADWELAKFVLDHSTEDTGTTPQYESPEQAEGRPVDQQSDQFQLGLIVYELLTGHHPFRDPDSTVPPRAITEAITEANPDPPSDRDSSVHGELDAIVLRMLSREPTDRYPAVLEVRRAFERCLIAERITSALDSSDFTEPSQRARHETALTRAASRNPWNGEGQPLYGVELECVPPVLYTLTERILAETGPDRYSTSCKECGAKPFAEGPHHAYDCHRLYPTFRLDTEKAHQYRCKHCRARPYPAGYHHKEDCPRHLDHQLPYAVSGFGHSGECKKCGTTPYPEGPHHHRDCDRYRAFPAYDTELAHNAKCKHCGARPYPAGPHHKRDCSRHVI